MKTKLAVAALALLALFAFAPQCPAFSLLGTGFTYQGRLNDGTGPANGVYDLQFTIYDSTDVPGSVIAGPITNSATVVSNGIFTVTVDLGANVLNTFNLSGRWLEIGARTNGAVSFVTLTPRQQISPTPYAFAAVNAAALLGNLPASQVQGTLSLAQLPSGILTNNQAGVSLSGGFAGDGSGLTNVNASTIGGIGTNGFWQIAGNVGTTPGANFIGTIDNQALEIRVNNTRAFRIEPTSVPSVEGGYFQNSTHGFSAAAIVGGGTSGSINEVFGDYGFIGAGHGAKAGSFSAVVGGAYNDANSQFSFVGAGMSNTNQGIYSFIGSGTNNAIQAGTVAAVIGGGRQNIIHKDNPHPYVLPAGYDFIGGGWSNYLSGGAITISGGYQNYVTSDFSTIGGGDLNFIVGFGTSGVIGGGFTNVIAGGFSCTIGGGQQNICSDSFSTIAGGLENFASGIYSTVGGGDNNSSAGAGGTIAGGFDNDATGLTAAVGGGENNNASGANTVIAGGASNIADANAAVVSGGSENHSSGDHSFIGGGQANLALPAYATIGGGVVNTMQINALSSTIGGGTNNAILGGAFDSVIGGGALNTIQTNAPGSAIAGGFGNTIQALAASATIGGGYQNTIQTNAFNAAIAGGSANTIQFSADDSIIGGGFGNVIQTFASYSIIGGGDINTIQTNSPYSTISGGSDNTVRTNALNATIGGGAGNTIQTNASYATIAGGQVNTANGNGATIGGGRQNVNGGAEATVGGGDHNFCTGPFATIGGGEENTNGAIYATLGGGIHNGCNGQYGTIGGGQQNIVQSFGATVPGGYLNFALGDYSFAAGRQAKATNQGAFVWADSQGTDFSSTTNDQFSIRAQGGVRINEDTSFYFGLGPGRQMLNLWGTQYGIGVQSLTTYFRTDNSGPGNGFSWFKGGVHNNGQNNPGTGGVELMRLTSAGLIVNGTFASASDRNVKAGFEPVDASVVLEKVAGLPITRWHYTNDVATAHVGPVAQDFYAAFSVGPDDKHIATVDEGGVALAAIQGLNRKLEAGSQKAEDRSRMLEARLEQKETEITGLKQRLEVLEKIILSQKSN